MDNFHKTELAKALSEVHYGIVAFRIDEAACNPGVAVALVDLMEQRQIRVELSNRGYKAVDTTEPDNGNETPTFEMLESLLSHFSPMFKARQSEELMTRLFRLQDDSE
ncbi:hypothetical protein BU17DRAFT_69053 [Hysterangium stoloniferum]|nr:hypothetical protein BU17DRAFT_69053 [Hysterangium stoloniferum]